MRKKLFLVTLFVVLLLSSITFSIKCSAGLKSVTIDNMSFDIDTVAEDSLEYIRNEYPIFDNDELNEYVDYKVDISEISDRSLIDKLVDSFLNKSYTVGYTYSFDIDGIKNYIINYNKTATNSKNAYIVKGDKSFNIVKEVYGNVIDLNMLVDNLSCDYEEICLSDYYIQPEIKKVDLEDTLSELDEYVNWHCKYLNGVELSSSIDYVDIKNGEIKVNKDWINEAISEVMKSYSTVGIEREFVTNTGDIVRLSSGTWGSEINRDAEVEYLTNSFLCGESIEDRIPIYAYSREEIGDTYIEISLDKQHVWVYKDGDLLMESDCVTGDSHLNRNTPIGMYFISERINGKYLRGDDYETWVNKWMRLTNTGVGLHDAYWRGSFGGDIYKTNGSHGCINLPKSFAYDLFDVVYTGMPVIIY